MADKKKMSVAEMLAAARKADGGGSSDAPAEPATPSDSTEDAPPAAEESSASAKEKSAAGQPPAKVAKPGSADRPSVADMLAMARANKSGGEKTGGEGSAPAAQAKSADPPASKAKPAPPGKSAAKPAAKAKPAAAQSAAPRDTASILAAARTSQKSGPTSKAEAAAKAQGADAVAAKSKPSVPPMPAKPAYARPKPAPEAKPPGDADRRDFLGIGFWSLGALGAIWSLLVVRFMFPNVLREPPSQFKVGFPDEFPEGQVQTKYKADYNVWVVNTEFNGRQELFALRTVCTHLGCTPNWLEAEQKFKCPCHGSGFYKDGINFEGPAPRPLERYAIGIADDGQVQVDKSRKFQEEMGQWDDPASFIPV